MLRCATHIRLPTRAAKNLSHLPQCKFYLNSQVKKIPTKIFVSGKYYDKSLVEKKIKNLRSLGHEITYDWTTKADIKEPRLLAREAVLAVAAIKESDVHVLIMTDKKYSYRGCFAELGCSITLGKEILVYCKPGKSSFTTSPFFNHPLVHRFNSWRKLLRAIDVASKI